MQGPATDYLFIIDPLASFHPDKDTTLVLMHEAMARGHQVWGCELSELYLHADRALAHAHPISRDGAASNGKLTQGPANSIDLGQFRAVFMRKDPPFDANYLAATWCLDRARGQTLLINDPQGLRELNEKLAISAFPELTPETRLLRKISDLRTTLSDFGGKMIVKPLLGYGGREVLSVRADDPNASTLFEMATKEESQWTIAQAFVPAAAEGDKRILMVDGEAIGAVLRVPAQGELRGNFHAGGTATRTELDDQDRAICARVGPFLRARGQFFAGLDVIGGYLTELNVTSPTGMQEVNRLEGRSGAHTMQAMFWDRLEALEAKSAS